MECRIPVRRLLPLVLLLGFATAGCGPSQQKGEAQGDAQGGAPAGAAPQAERRFVEKSFDVDPALLGYTYDDSTLGIRFAPPRGWAPLDEEMFGQVRAALERIQLPEHHFVSRPVRIFYGEAQHGYMIVSEFRNWPTPLDAVAAMDEYRSMVAATDADLALHESVYRHGKLDVYQLILTNPLMVDTRLIAMREGRPPVQIDYLVPLGALEAVGKAIEASVGSIAAI